MTAPAAPADAPSRVLARFAYENGIGSMRRIAAFLGMEVSAFTRWCSDAGWGGRGKAPTARALALFLASYDAPATSLCADGERVDCGAGALAGELRAFVASRLSVLASQPETSAARDIVDLTRCLKELTMLEDKLARSLRHGEGGEEGESRDAAIMGTGTASDLAEIVALQVECLHERHGAGGALDALYPADAADAGDELGSGGA
ncbi:MAG: hypothetical protein JJU21_03395 [Salinarimonas sp.]|nr:hypothetical protein [Salinarimonas sp.]